MNINVPAMMKLSIDIKQMPPNHGYSHILVLLCEVFHYMVALPLHSTKIPHILDVFQRGYLAYFGPPSNIVCDQDPAFTSSLMEAIEYQTDNYQPNQSQILASRTWNKKFVRSTVKHLSEAWS